MQEEQEGNQRWWRREKGVKRTVWKLWQVQYTLKAEIEDDTVNNFKKKYKEHEKEIGCMDKALKKLHTKITRLCSEWIRWLHLLILAMFFCILTVTD